jgi:hypothetical protein
LIGTVLLNSVDLTSLERSGRLPHLDVPCEPTETEKTTMPNRFARNGVLGAATATAMLGLLGQLTPVHADPIPLPPNCNNQFRFESTGLDLLQDDGTDVFPQVAQSGTTFTGGVYYLAGAARKKTTGNVTGGTLNGNTISFTANWDSGGWNKYTGTINPDTSMTGATLSNTGGYEHWTAGPGSLKCNPPPAPPQPVGGGGTPPVAGGGGGTPPPVGHTITGDVKLYDKAGGHGKVIGQLNQGDAVTENGQCPIVSAGDTNGWCLVTDTTQGVSGAVWGDYVSK